MARATFVTSGLEHLGVAALSAYVRSRGHEAVLHYEPKPFSSNTGFDNAVLASWLEPSPARTAEQILDTRPDVVAFSSYTITHRWSVQVARELKRRREVAIVFGGPHVNGAAARAILEPSIDAIVEGEGEGALVDLLECAQGGTFTRTDVGNCWFRGDGKVIRNPLRPLIEDLDTLPFADKEGFYAAVPAFEREYYIVARRGCPYKCSFCEYSSFASQYGGQKPVRRRSVASIIDELTPVRRRGVMRKVFFWDAIFTLDQRWMDEFAVAYRKHVGVPFECYTHPSVMTRDMAQALGRAGCGMVRIGSQTVNSDTLAAMDRRGDADRLALTIGHLDSAGVPYSLDHILGLPGEGPEDQRKAVRFYNALRPRRMFVHWMTYFPGTTEFDRARESGLLSPAQVERILTGEQTDGFEAPRLVGRGAEADALREIELLSLLFDLMPLLPRSAITKLLESGAYRFLPRGQLLRLAVAAIQLVGGEVATRERLAMMLRGAIRAAVLPLRRRYRAGDPPKVSPPLPVDGPKTERLVTIRRGATRSPAGYAIGRAQGT